MEIEGSVALVTGANRGLGLHVARELLARGATVYATARDPGTVDLPGATVLRLGLLHRVLATHQRRHRRRAAVRQRGGCHRLHADLAEEDHLQHHRLGRHPEGCRVRDLRRMMLRP